MKVNPQMFQAMLMKYTTNHIVLPEYIKVNDIKIGCHDEVKLLGICSKLYLSIFDQGHD